MKGRYTALYIRRGFEIDGTEGILGLTLSIRADDGCVAYLNGA